jgi:hypothetical protein
MLGYIICTRFYSIIIVNLVPGVAKNSGELIMRSAKATNTEGLYNALILLAIIIP